MTPTKKLPVTGKGRGNFLIPQLLSAKKSGFINIKTGKRTEFGFMSYIDVPVTAEDILTRFCERNELPTRREVALRLLESYVAALQEFKIGNVLSIDYPEEGAFRLLKTADTPSLLRKLPLP
jgi:hypothetical protein